MNDLIKTVSQKAGLSEEQAHKAVAAVADFAKSKFPSMAGQIDSLLGGGGGTSGAAGGESNPLGDIAGKIGGMLGK